MNKALLLRLHRWAALTFAVPLLVIIVTGLVLSFEPLAIQSAIRPGSVMEPAVTELLRRHDPQGTARALLHRPQEHTLSVAGREFDLRTGELTSDQGRTLSDIFGAARRLHERLIFGVGWLVPVSTAAMLALVGLGMLIGWPRLRNTVPGWHKGLGWLPLPLVILSPLTGLMLALGISLGPASPSIPAGTSPSLTEAVRILGAEHDLSGLLWIRPFGDALVARIVKGGELRTYTITHNGVVPSVRNWPRLLHEGTWGGPVLPILNAAISLALLGLVGTGIWIWTQRRLRRSMRQRTRDHEVGDGPITARHLRFTSRRNSLRR